MKIVCVRFNVRCHGALQDRCIWYWPLDAINEAEVDCSPKLAETVSLLVCATFGVEVETAPSGRVCSYILAAVILGNRVWHGPNAGELL